jgi:hypothetical protein
MSNPARSTKRTTTGWPLAVVLMLIVILVVISARLGVRTSQAQRIPYHPDSTGWQGLRTFEAWMIELGYREVRVNTLTSVPNDLNALVLMPAARPLTPTEVDAVLGWVERGGRLIVGVEEFRRPFSAADPEDLVPPRDPLLERLTLQLQRTPTDDRRGLVQPMLSDLGWRAVSPQTDFHLTRYGAGWTELVANDSTILVLAQPRGAGMVIVTADPDAFTNGRLSIADADIPKDESMIHGMFASLPRGSTIGIDVSRQDTSASRARDLNWLLFNTPWGLAILFGLAMTLITLLLNGQRFGRVKPLMTEVTRRSPAEYVTSMARLFRRGDKRTAMLDHYRRQIKRQLGRPHGVDATLPDEDFVTELAKIRDDIDRDALRSTLRQLSAASNPSIREAELIRRVNAAESFTRRKP